MLYAVTIITLTKDTTFDRALSPFTSGPCITDGLLEAKIYSVIYIYIFPPQHPQNDPNPQSPLTHLRRNEGNNNSQILILLILIDENFRVWLGPIHLRTLTMYKPWTLLLQILWHRLHHTRSFLGRSSSPAAVWTPTLGTQMPPTHASKSEWP